jgi:hypothetical protein
MTFYYSTLREQNLRVEGLSNGDVDKNKDKVHNFIFGIWFCTEAKIQTKYEKN